MIPLAELSGMSPFFHPNFFLVQKSVCLIWYLVKGEAIHVLADLRSSPCKSFTSLRPSASWFESSSNKPSLTGWGARGLWPLLLGCLFVPDSDARMISSECRTQWSKVNSLSEHTHYRSHCRSSGGPAVVAMPQSEMQLQPRLDKPFTGHPASCELLPGKFWR